MKNSGVVTRRGLAGASVKWLGAWVILVSAAGCSESEVPVEAAAVEPGEWLPGGDTTNTLLSGTNAFIRPVENITEAHQPLFYSGNSFFNQAWVEAPASTGNRDGLGPFFNARSCSACHFKDGRGAPPEAGAEFEGMLLRVGLPERVEHGAPRPDPVYGDQIQPFALPGLTAEGLPRVDYEEISGTYDDGEPYTLLKPGYRIDALGFGPLAEGAVLSPRVAPIMVGLGLLEAIPESRLAALADPDDRDGDGVRGRINRVWDAEATALVAGRFGWKAEQPTVRQQVAGAFLGDMGLTTPIFGEQACTEAQTECAAQPTGAEPGAFEVDAHTLERVAVYSSLVAVPAREGFADENVLRGKALFSAVGCAACHVPSHVTGEHALPEVVGQTIWPYTDLLLHDLGDDLSDGRPSFEAEGVDWRTPPLWGLGRVPTVNRHNRLLHDGRARGVAEAILWHGGEASTARAGFVALSATQRADLVRFVESL